MKKVITGTGRCGTSLIMHILTVYGENTGYSIGEAEESISRIDGLNAGIEHNIKTAKKADWIKNPQWIKTNELKEVIDKYGVSCVYIPIRDLESTAKSRDHQTKHTHGGYGGLWLGARNVQEQQAIHAIMTYHLINYLADEGIKYRIISFDRMLSDPRYLFHRLELEDYDKFLEVYNELVDLDKVRF